MEIILVLDTNAYSDWRRFGRWNENLAIADRVLIPAIVIGELHHGFLKGGRFEGNATRLDEFLREPQVDVIPVSRRTAEIYGEFLHFLQESGTPIPTNDIWIAAMVREMHGKLATRDGHFGHLPLVELAREI